MIASPGIPFPSTCSLPYLLSLFAFSSFPLFPYLSFAFPSPPSPPSRSASSNLEKWSLICSVFWLSYLLDPIFFARARALGTGGREGEEVFTVSLSTLLLSISSDLHTFTTLHLAPSLSMHLLLVDSTSTFVYYWKRRIGGNKGRKRKREKLKKMGGFWVWES